MLRSFGRVQARALKPRQAALVRDLLPALALPPQGALTRDALFPPAATAMALEIGFGGGEHLAAQVAARPELGVIGAEPFLNGVAKCVSHLDGAPGADRVRLHHGDAREILPRIPDGALSRIWLLFPDPWPKLRHHKRRLVDAAFLGEVARLLAPGAELRFATDWHDYAAWTLERCLRAPQLEWIARSAQDWREPFDDHVPTRYEMKRLGDTAPIFLRFRRRGR